MTRRRSVDRWARAWALVLALALVLLSAWSTAGCRPDSDDGAEPETSATTSASISSDGGMRWTDVTAEAGLDFVHHNGASGNRYLPETMGAGVAFADFDGDDIPDLFWADGVEVTAALGTERTTDRPAGRLYLGRGDGTFRDATVLEGTDGSGFGPAFLAMGVAVGDLDGDGLLDLFVSGVGAQRLYLNAGRGTFRDVTAAAGLDPADPGFGTSAAFFDADLDGDLDLFVGRYVPWTQESDVRCSPDGVHHTYCTPEVYPSAPNAFYRNLGPGSNGTVPRFEDATAAAGLDQPRGKTLGVAVVDADGDGRPDLAVANDTDRNHLFVQRRGGRFEEVGVETGLAFSISGATRGAMGIDAGDIDGDGRDDLAVGNFAQEMAALYLATEAGLFRDEAARLGVGLPSLMQVAFGTLLVDLNLDGRLDLVLANGHIEPEIARYQSVHTYRQPLGIYRNAGTTFEPVVGDGPLAESYVGRGLAAADFDGDGDLDLVLTQNGGPARLLRNDAEHGRWLRVRLVPRAGTGTPYGARLTLTAGSLRLERSLRAGRSYLSASEPIVTFGLGDVAEDVTTADRLEIRWPSGATQVIERPELDRLLVISEPVEEPAP